MVVQEECFSDNFLRALNMSGCDTNFSFSALSISFLKYSPLCCADHLDGTSSRVLDKFLLTLVSFIPILVILPVILLFNIHLASGPKQAFIFFYQCMPVTSSVVYNFNPGMFYIFTACLGELLTLHSPFEIIFWPDVFFSAPFHIMEYVKVLFAILAVCLSLLLVKCTSCPLQKCRLPWAKVRRAMRNFREKHVPGSTILQGICSIVVLVYGDLVTVSFSLLQRTTAYCANHIGVCPRLCTDIPYNSVEYKPYFWTAISVLVLLLPLPLSLIYYPSIPALFNKLTGRSLPRFPKLAPVFDVFQGVYKDKMRWFAGVHFLYIYVLWFVNASVAQRFQRQYYLLCLLAIIASIQSALQPFKKPVHNYIQTLVLLNFVLQSIFGLTLPCSARDPHRQKEAFVTALIWVALITLPIAVLVIYHLRKFVLKRLQENENCVHFVMKFLKQRKQLSSDGIDGDYLISERSTAYHDFNQCVEGGAAQV